MITSRFAALRFVARGLALWLALTFSAQAAASPSVFLEDAASLALGYSGAPSARLGAELLLDVAVVDASIALEALIAESWRTRLSLSALLLPALGTTPPLAVGVGADLGFGAEGLSAHLGPTLGTDLLFTLDLPMTASLYLAPGYDAGGFSLAWSAQLRYYFDDLANLGLDAGLGGGLALELESSDLQLLSLGLRLLF